MNSQRFSRLKELMVGGKFDILALNAGVDLEYFTGLKFHLSERPVILLIPVEGTPVLFFPEFEHEKINKSEIELVPFPYPEDTNKWPLVFLNAANEVEMSSKTVGVAPESMRFLELDLIQKSTINCQIISAMEILKSLKIQKDADEISAIRNAISIAERSLLALLPQIKPGVSEKWLANQLVIHLLTNGSEPDLPFNPIIASGPNSANPHAEPGERVLIKGDSLIIDWGARYGGYISDLTRSFLIGGENTQMKQIADIVLKANQSARNAARAGISACDVDKAARDVIAYSGYSAAFTHRAGHGIGLLPHEDPFISQTNSSLLKDRHGFYSGTWHLYTRQRWNSH